LKRLFRFIFGWFLKPLTVGSQKTKRREISPSGIRTASEATHPKVEAFQPVKVGAGPCSIPEKAVAVAAPEIPTILVPTSAENIIENEVADLTVDEAKKSAQQTNIVEPDKAILEIRASKSDEQKSIPPGASIAVKETLSEQIMSERTFGLERREASKAHEDASESTEALHSDPDSQGQANELQHPKESPFAQALDAKPTTSTPLS